MDFDIIRPIISGLLGGVTAVYLTIYISKQVGKSTATNQLHFTKFMWGLAITCLLLALFPIGLTLAGHEKELWAKVSLFIGFGAGAIYCFGEARFVRGSFDSKGIEFYTPWTGVKKEKWNDLISIEVNDLCSWHTLTFKSGKKIRLSKYLAGHHSALEIAERKLESNNKNTNNKVQKLDDNQKKEPVQNDTIVIVVTFILFVFGVFLSFFNSLFAVLTFLFPLTLGVYFVDKLSKAIFKKEFEYHSRYSGKTMEWSDILLTIPLLFIGLYPMFIIGEAADCYLGSNYWAITIGFCK